MEEKGRLYKDTVFLWLERKKQTQMKRLLYPLVEEKYVYKFFSKGKLDLLRSHESLWMKREWKDNGGDKQLERQV